MLHHFACTEATSGWNRAFEWVSAPRDPLLPLLFLVLHLDKNVSVTSLITPDALPSLMISLHASGISEGRHVTWLSTRTSSLATLLIVSIFSFSVLMARTDVIAWLECTQLASLAPVEERQRVFHYSYHWEISAPPLLHLPGTGSVTAVVTQRKLVLPCSLFFAKRNVMPQGHGFWRICATGVLAVIEWDVTSKKSWKRGFLFLERRQRLKSTWWSRRMRRDTFSSKHKARKATRVAYHMAQRRVSNAWIQPLLTSVKQNDAARFLVVLLTLMGSLLSVTLKKIKMGLLFCCCCCCFEF